MWTLATSGVYEVISEHKTARGAVRAGIRYNDDHGVDEYVPVEVWHDGESYGDPNDMWAESGGTRGMFR